MRGGEPTPVASLASVDRDVRPRSGPGALGHFARVVIAYLLVLAFVVPPPLAGAAAHRGQKSGHRQRGKDRPTAAAKVLLSLAADRFRGPERSAAVAAGPSRNILSPPVLPPALSQNPFALTRVFRPLRC